MLFPIIRGEDGVDPASITDEEDDDYAEIGNERDEASDAEPAAKNRRYIPPSSVGFSFYARGELVRFQVIYSASRYKYVERDPDTGQFVSNYIRESLGGDAEAQIYDARRSKIRRQFSQRKDVLGQHAGIDVLWRPFLDGWIVTVSLSGVCESPLLSSWPPAPQAKGSQPGIDLTKGVLLPLFRAAVTHHIRALDKTAHTCWSKTFNGVELASNEAVAHCAVRVFE